MVGMRGMMVVRKSLCRVLCCLMVICCACSAPIHAAEEGMLGDVTADGRIDASDALMVLQASVGLISTFPAAFVYGIDNPGDVNKDNRTNASDALLILQMSVGLIDEFPIADKPDEPIQKIWPEFKFIDEQFIYLPYNSDATFRIAVDESKSNVDCTLFCRVETELPSGWFGARTEKVSHNMFELHVGLGDIRFDVPSVIEVSVYARDSVTLKEHYIGNVFIYPGRR